MTTTRGSDGAGRAPARMAALAISWARHRIAWRAMVALLALLFALCGASLAGAQAPEPDPPGRVARVSDVAGQAWLLSVDSSEWIGIDRNRPVTSGDRLVTDSGARLELEIGSTTLRLDGATELDVTELDDARVLLDLHQGSAALRIRDAEAVGAFELATAEGRFRVQTAGRYRFDRAQASSQLTVQVGHARFEGSGTVLMVDAGQRAAFWIEPNGIAQYSIMPPVADAFAAWDDVRAREEDRLHAAAGRYVSPEMTGARDLDRYGRWESSAEYGPVWFPIGVAAGWVPYSSGHWAWVRPWGWTWVDGAIWGFAPFHYGRWLRYRGAWCWAPGSYMARPVYAPALVAWIGGAAGGGGGWQVDGRPAVGWFPLAPREAYLPGYRTSSRYLRDVNRPHVSEPGRLADLQRGAATDFRNRHEPHAVTVVPSDVVGRREAVAPSAARWRDQRDVRRLVEAPGRATVQPVAPESIAIPDSPRGRSMPPRGGERVRSWSPEMRAAPSRREAPAARPGAATEPAGIVVPGVPGAPAGPSGRPWPGRAASVGNAASPGAAVPGGSPTAAMPERTVVPGWQRPPAPAGEPARHGDEHVRHPRPSGPGTAPAAGGDAVRSAPPGVERTAPERSAPEPRVFAPRDGGGGRRER